MHPNDTPYFPENIAEYAPWVAKHGLFEPYGKCQCGCGKDVAISHANFALYGYAVRQPKRFVKGHIVDSIQPGQRFGRLTVISRSPQRRGTRRLWICKCDCGNETIVITHSLLSGTTKSCGCINSEQTTARNMKHGLTYHPLYSTWTGVIQRCTYPSAGNYANYGGRGITLCNEWRHDFEAFHDYVTKLPHYGEPGRTLDRIDNDGNYEPGNLRWSTRSEQRRNSRQPFHGDNS